MFCSLTIYLVPAVCTLHNQRWGKASVKSHGSPNDSHVISALMSVLLFMLEKGEGEIHCL